VRQVRLPSGDSDPRAGVVFGDRAIAFASLQQRRGVPGPDLPPRRAYPAGSPESERAAGDLSAWGAAYLDKLLDSEGPRLACTSSSGWRALRELGLMPRQLRNSAAALRKHERDDPQTAPLLQAFAEVLLDRSAATPAGQPEPLSCDKSNRRLLGALPRTRIIGSARATQGAGHACASLLQCTAGVLHSSHVGWAERMRSPTDDRGSLGFVAQPNLPGLLPWGRL
jgi:hypothetical protein